MANKRMFSKDIVSSTSFIMLSNNAKVLYFYICMDADDDGFCDSVEVQERVTLTSQEDLQELLDKRFILKVEGAYLVKHWLIHNTIRKDTYNRSNYWRKNLNIEKDENNSYTVSQRAVNEPLTQVSLDKNRLDKNSIDKISNNKEEEIERNKKENIEILLSFNDLGYKITEQTCKNYNVDYELIVNEIEKRNKENE